ncbi:unnamed protein product [Boreogadus saida]
MTLVTTENSRQSIPVRRLLKNPGSTVLSQTGCPPVRGSLSSTTRLLFVPGKEKRQVEDGDALPYRCATLRPGTGL